jgi:prepilin-type N-terminal cleavage/methylation domain-containing protein
MRRAFSLVEMIVVVCVLPIFLVMTSRVFVLLGREIPKSTSLMAEQALVQQILDLVRRDLDEAKALIESDDPQTLRIQKAQGVVVYEAAHGKVTRTVARPGDGAQEPDAEWAVPDASIRWRRLGQGTEAHAVEVHTGMIQKTAHGDQERLASAHVFFLVHGPEEVLP